MMASCHSTSVAAPSGRWIGSEWQKLVGPDCEDRQQHERQIPGESISLSLILRRQNLWWWDRGGPLPSVMSTFGEILAHLGTVIMGVQGVRHIGHIGTAGYNQLGRPPYPQT